VFLDKIIMTNLFYIFRHQAATNTHCFSLRDICKILCLMFALPNFAIKGMGVEESVYLVKLL